MLGQCLIRGLKAEDQTLEADSFWRHLLNRPLGWVFNGDLKQSFARSGFEWEVADANSHRLSSRAPNTGVRCCSDVHRQGDASAQLRKDMLRPASY